MTYLVEALEYGHELWRIGLTAIVLDLNQILAFFGLFVTHGL